MKNGKIKFTESESFDDRFKTIRYVDIERGDVVFFPSDKTNTKNDKPYFWQYDGCGCLNTLFKEKPEFLFNSKHKYFNPNFWYKRASWFDDFGFLFFHYNDMKEFRQKYEDYIHKGIGRKKTETEKITDRIFKKGGGIYEIYKAGGFKDPEMDSLVKEFITPYEDKLSKKTNVLAEILFIVRKKMKARVEFNGKHENDWTEAFIPVKINGRSGIIGWINCD